jgi:NADH-quinone oxidoreductase subunit F
MMSKVNLGLVGIEPDTQPLTWRYCRAGGPVLDLKHYQSLGGYAAVRKALEDLSPAEVQGVVRDSGLRGRGGAGFPTGVKWSLIPMGSDVGQKYLVCNADEMEPGTYKDRMLLEGLPHQMIEAMIVSAYAIQANRAYIFLRGEYVLAAERLTRAIAEAEAAGYLGRHILGSTFSLELHVHGGAGRYICGEETALLNSLEGRRANPRAKPPFPQGVGAWTRPTVVNNVETLYSVPAIVLNGADWFKGLSAGKSAVSGTKLYGVAGRVQRPGLWELPMGTLSRELLEEHAGGMAEGRGLMCWLPGGASTDFLLPEHLDLPMDYEAIAGAGSRFGTGLMLAIDDRQDIVSVVRNIEAFMARESCGWCTPCREGLPWILQVLAALERGEGRPGDVEWLEDMTRQLGPGRTFCAHAPGAMEPLQSALRLFRPAFERGVAAPTVMG